MNIAIVTGVLGGIGKESALHLCRRGYTVVGMDVVDAADLSDFAGFDFTYVKGDLASAESRKDLVETAAKKGNIAALINVAGVAPKVRNDGGAKGYFSPEAVKAMSRSEVKKNYDAILRSMEKWN